MTIANAVQKAEMLIRWLDERIDGLALKSDDRSRVAAGCLDVALEHQKTIVLLIHHKLYGSAFSLVRLAFESYIRGVWLLHCASDTQLKQIKHDKLKKSLEELLKEVEKVDGYNEGVLSAVKQRSWKSMNSYTHTGFLQIVRRSKESTIEPNYGNDEIMEVLNFAIIVGFLAALAEALMAGSLPLANDILSKAQRAFNAEP